MRQLEAGQFLLILEVELTAFLVSVNCILNKCFEFNIIVSVDALFHDC